MDAKSQSKSLPSEWTGALFDRFRSVYGNRAETMWSAANRDDLLQVWGETLAGYSGDDLKRALAEMMLHHADYPPTLPQFTQLCNAARLRRMQDVGKLSPPRAPMPQEVKQRIEAMDLTKKRGDGRDWARQILADGTGTLYPRISYEFARQALGLDRVPNRAAKGSVPSVTRKDSHQEKGDDQHRDRPTVVQLGTVVRQRQSGHEREGAGVVALS